MQKIRRRKIVRRGLFRRGENIIGKGRAEYQYGKGCLSDGVLGAWIARMCGLADPIDAAKIKSHLLAVHKYNLRKI
jgi:hypothetical protein